MEPADMTRFQNCFLLFCVLLRVFTVAEAADIVHLPPSPCAFIHANVVPMNEEKLLSDQTVVVQNGRITQVGPSKTTVLARGTCRIDAKGKFLIPGLVDAHVHLLSPNELPLY